MSHVWPEFLKARQLRYFRLYRRANAVAIKDLNRKYAKANAVYIKDRKRKWDKANAVSIKARRRKYAKANAVSIKDQKRKYRMSHRSQINAQERLRRKTDPGLRLVRTLRSRLRHALNGNTKSAKTLDLLGCSVDECKDHLERQFTKGMSWGNRSLWHIDHIRPCASFDMSLESDQRACFHYSNLQPLWAADNLSKGSTY